MMTEQPQSRHARRLERDRRRSVVEMAPDRFGLDHAGFVRRESGELVLQLVFIPGLDRMSGCPPELGVEHVVITDLDTGNSAPFVLLAIEQGDKAWVLDLVLEPHMAGAGVEENGVFEVRIVGRSDVDPHFSAADFGVGVMVESEPLGSPAKKTAHALPSPANYLYKDEASFRGLMLDRLGRSVPAWRERSVPDLGVTIVEAISHVADLSSYFQDAVATEAYIDTARQRQSVRRHGRLVGVRLCEGSGAGTWISFSCQSSMIVPADTRVGTAEPSTHSDSVHASVDMVFRTCSDALIHPEQNKMRPHCWGMAPLQLAPGSSTMALKGHFKSLVEGTVLALEVPGLRHAVRLSRAPVFAEDNTTEQPVTIIHWSSDDALPQGATLDDRDGGDAFCFVTGNMVLAQQGQRFTIPNAAIRPKPNGLIVELSGARVLRFEIPKYGLPASKQRSSHLGSALPDMIVVQTHRSGRRTVWSAVSDLLSSKSIDCHFVAEQDNQGRVHLRFGDGLLGRSMPPAEELTVVAGLGQGRSGNVFEDSLAFIHTFVSGLTSARNPVPAVGGRDAESLESARRRVMRGGDAAFACVEPSDFARLAMRVPGVRQAVALSDWAGTWPVISVYVLPEDMDASNEALFEETRILMEKHRRMGVKVEVLPATAVNIQLAFKVVVRTGVPQVAIERRIRQALGGPGGLFDADRWRLGEVPYEAQVVKTIAGVDGVLWSETLVFQRRDRLRSAGAGNPIELAEYEVLNFEQRNVEIQIEVAG